MQNKEDSNKKLHNKLCESVMLWFQVRILKGISFNLRVWLGYWGQTTRSQKRMKGKYKEKEFSMGMNVWSCGKCGNAVCKETTPYSSGCIKGSHNWHKL